MSKYNSLSLPLTINLPVMYVYTMQGHGGAMTRRMESVQYYLVHMQIHLFVVFKATMIDTLLRLQAASTLLCMVDLMQRGKLSLQTCH